MPKGSVLRGLRQQSADDRAPQTDHRNPHPWYDITCGTCCSIIATVRIVPDDKPVEPSSAILNGASGK
jgi:hypothetical protein